MYTNKLLFLDYSECGIRSKSRSSRMVGGVESVHGMWPWQAGLYRLDQTTGKITAESRFLERPRVTQSRVPGSSVRKIRSSRNLDVKL